MELAFALLERLSQYTLRASNPGLLPWEAGEEEKLREDFRKAKGDLVQVVQVYSAGLSPELMRLCAALLSKSGSVCLGLESLIVMPGDAFSRDYARDNFAECSATLKQIFHETGTKRADESAWSKEVEEFNVALETLIMTAKQGRR